jgi:hypothetical protein
MSRNSTPAKNTGSTNFALGFFTCFVSLDFGLTTVSSSSRSDSACFRSRAPAISESPVQPVAGKDFPLPLVQMDMHAVAVEFDFMEPLRSDRCLAFHGRKLGLNESRHHRLLDHRPALFTHTLYGLSPPPAGAVSLTAAGSGMRGHVLVSKSI